MPNVGAELLSAPVDQIVAKLSLAIAQGQTALDASSVATAKSMATTMIELPDISDPSKMVPFPLIALGFFPKFYEFSETVIEVKMAISMAQSSEFGLSVGVKAGWGPVAAQVNASYSQKYSYNVEGSSLVRVRMAPVPPPTILQNYMDGLVQKMLETNTKLTDANQDKPALPPG